MELRQAVIGHTDLAIPFGFKLDISDLREQALQRFFSPCRMNGRARIAQRSNAAKHQTALAVETERR